MSYGLFGVLVLIVIYWLILPEKAEIVSGQLYRLLRNIWSGAEKKYIAHDTQGRVNDYVNNFLSKEIKDFEPINVQLDWVEETYLPEAFFNDGKLIVRLKQSDNQNRNFVNASLVFIAQNVLRKAKRYISDKQRESIDLFVAKKMFEKEKDDVMTQFVDDYLSEKIDDEKVGAFFEKYHYIDTAGLFFPVFIQEMSFLGEKVFAQRKDQTIYQEVNGLIEFLDKYSVRKIGDTSIDSKFNGLYCKFGMMIVGIGGRIKSEGSSPYETHLEYLQSSGVESIYLIGDSRNKEFIDSICSSLCGGRLKFGVYNTKEYSATITYQDGTKENKGNYLVVLRKNQVEHYFPTQRT
ncbi:MAG: hypothetical protein Q7S61_03340 [bacterium]|nr:hypothetical protein [bacterium]